MRGDKDTCPQCPYVLNCCQTVFLLINLVFIPMVLALMNETKGSILIEDMGPTVVSGV